MLDTSARLLKLLSLMQARADWSGPELAARLGVGVRTVRRDVERLRTLGYPVHAAPGVAGGYRLGAGASLPPLLLDEEEAIAVAVALRTAASATVTGIEETALRALTKLEGVLPPPLRRRVTAVSSAMVPYPSFGAPVDPGLLALLAAAIRDRERLRLRYRDHAGISTRRLVEPYRLVPTGRRWYLVAWDAGREDWRTFRVDRIEPTPSSAGRYTAREPPAADIAAYVARGVSAARDTHQARVLLHAPLATVAPRVPPSTGTLEAVDEYTCLLHTGADWLGGLAIYVAAIGVDFEVLDPPELTVEIRRLAERFTRAVDGPRTCSDESSAGAEGTTRYAVSMEPVSTGELVKVAGGGPERDGIVFDIPSKSKVVVAVVNPGRGPVLRTVHPKLVSERSEEGPDDRALQLLIRRTPPPPVRGAAGGGMAAAGRGSAGHARGTMHRTTGK